MDQGIEYVVASNGVEYIRFKNLAQYSDSIVHGFTTRRGGVSGGECSSLNLGFKREDLRENVMENFMLVSEALGIDYRHMVFSDQVHGNVVKCVGERERGNGITGENTIGQCDGLMTNEARVALVTFYADCVPVFFYDPVKNAAALAHSGWRGTVKQIARAAVREMAAHFDVKAGDLEAALGPCIGQCCFEVGREVYDEFVSRMDWSEKYCLRSGDEKWNIDLAGIIKETLARAGVKEEKIVTANVCTSCRRDLFFSHRAEKGRTGSMAAIIQIL